MSFFKLERGMILFCAPPCALLQVPSSVELAGNSHIFLADPLDKSSSQGMCMREQNTRPLAFSVLKGKMGVVAGFGAKNREPPQIWVGTVVPPSSPHSAPTFSLHNRPSKRINLIVIPRPKIPSARGPCPPPATVHKSSACHLLLSKILD